MTRPKLTAFELRFPRELPDNAVLSALGSFSGLPHGSRVVLRVRGDHEGIRHQLAVTLNQVEAVTAALRAAVPSLHLEPTDELIVEGQPWLWQLTPRLGALRVDGLPASAAALLACLFPLGAGEVISLAWHVRPGPRPVLPPTTKDRPARAQKALRLKLEQPGLLAVGELTVTASEPARRRLLLQRVASVLRTLSSPAGRLDADSRWLARLAWLLGRRGRYLSAAELAAVIGWPIAAPDLPGLSLGAAKRLVPGRGLATTGRVLGTSNFGGFNRPVAVSPRASTKGTWLLGPTGVGKTSLIKNLIVDDLKAGRGLVVMETNGDLINETLDALPAERLKDVVLLDPTDKAAAVGLNPFASSAEPTLVADQLGELFERLWSAYWGPRTAQLAHMGLLTLARRRGSTLLDLPRLFLEDGFRDEVLSSLDDPLGLGPDWRWFQGLSAAEQTTVVSPLLNKVRQFTARPSVRAIIGQARPRISLADILRQQKVLLVQLPKGLIGTETARLLGCLVLTGLWQAFTERTALSPGQRQPVGVYVDELQDFAAAPVPWEELFSQGRKYGAAVTVAHQNLEQLPRDLRATVLANARTKAVFALGATDAKALERIFAPSLAAADLQALDPYSLAAVIATDDGGVSRPVTLAAPPPLEPTGTVEAARASSAEQYARPAAEVEAALRGKVSPKPAVAPVGRKPRSRA